MVPKNSYSSCKDRGPLSCTVLLAVFFEGRARYFLRVRRVGRYAMSELSIGAVVALILLGLALNVVVGAPSSGSPFFIPKNL